MDKSKKWKLSIAWKEYNSTFLNPSGDLSMDMIGRPDEDVRHMEGVGKIPKSQGERLSQWNQIFN